MTVEEITNQEAETKEGEDAADRLVKQMAITMQLRGLGLQVQARGRPSHVLRGNNLLRKLLVQMVLARRLLLSSSRPGSPSSNHHVAEATRHPRTLLLHKQASRQAIMSVHQLIMCKAILVLLLRTPPALLTGSLHPVLGAAAGPSNATGLGMEAQRRSQARHSKKRNMRACPRHRIAGGPRVAVAALLAAVAVVVSSSSRAASRAASALSSTPNSMHHRRTAHSMASTRLMVITSISISNTPACLLA